VLGEIGVSFGVCAAGTDDQVPPGLDELRGWCREHLADYKAPDRLQLVGSLPLTAMGKVDVRELGRRAGVAGRSALSATTGGTR